MYFSEMEEAQRQRRKAVLTEAIGSKSRVLGTADEPAFCMHTISQATSPIIHWLWGTPGKHTLEQTGSTAGSLPVMAYIRVCVTGKHGFHGPLPGVVGLEWYK